MQYLPWHAIKPQFMMIPVKSFGLNYGMTQIKCMDFSHQKNGEKLTVFLIFIFTTCIKKLIPWIRWQSSIMTQYDVGISAIDLNYGFIMSLTIILIAHILMSSSSQSSCRSNLTLKRGRFRVPATFISMKVIFEHRPPSDLTNSIIWQLQYRNI